MCEAVRSVVISFLFLSTVSLAAARSIKRQSNPLGIDWDPAPPPQDGPPLSAGALRDPAYLPAQIVGIVGSYVFIVCVVGAALLIIGRRRRRLQEQSRDEILVFELIQPSVQNYASPLSPIDSSYPIEKSVRTPYIFPAPQIHSPQSPGTDPNVDVRVVEADREMLQRDLEDLYAHVMEHEDAKEKGIAPPDPLSKQKRDVPLASPQRSSKPTSIKVDRNESKKQKTSSRASSIISSLRSPKSRIKGLHISSPIATPLSSTFPSDYISDDEPLSPRQPPPLPPMSSDQSSDEASPTLSIAEQLAHASFPQHKLSQSISSSKSDPNPLFSNPIGKSTSAPKVSIPAKPSGNLPASPRPDSKHQKPAPLTQSTNNSSRSLPFRAFEPPGSPNSPAVSQATTKTTILERKGPLSPGLRTPWTAGSVPYSPYQPNTPVVPVTPTLVTKQHRKMMKKREKRMPVLEMVSSAEEMWDSGY